MALSFRGGVRAGARPHDEGENVKSFYCGGFWVGFCASRFASFQEHLGATLVRRAETWSSLRVQALVKEMLQNLYPKPTPSPAQHNQGLGDPSAPAPNFHYLR